MGILLATSWAPTGIFFTNMSLSSFVKLLDQSSNGDVLREDSHHQ